MRGIFGFKGVGKRESSLMIKDIKPEEAVLKAQALVGVFRGKSESRNTYSYTQKWCDIIKIRINV